MLKIIQLVDRIIPFWELIVVGLALFAIVLVLLLWWAFGYNLIVVPEPQAAAKPVAVALSFL